MFKWNKILFITFNQQYSFTFAKLKNTSNISLNHLIIPCKPPASSNTTTHHKTNFQHHKYRVLQVFKSNKILFITFNQQYSFTFAKLKNTPNISLNHLIIPCKPPTSSNTTTHYKTNFQHHKYRVLQVFKLNKILFITSNQKYSFIFVRNKKHSQYVFKPPYNTMQVTRLLQHNNLP